MTERQKDSPWAHSVVLHTVWLTVWFTLSVAHSVVLHSALFPSVSHPSPTAKCLIFAKRDHTPGPESYQLSAALVSATQIITLAGRLFVHFRALLKIYLITKCMCTCEGK